MHDIDRMLALQLEGKWREAREISDKLEALGPTKILDPRGVNTQDIWFRHCFNRGWFLLQEGLYQEGSQLLEHGRFLNCYGSPPLGTNAPIYNPSQHDIKGKSIIVSLEGGYGDEIINARFATSYKKLGAKHVYIATVPELKSIFSRIEGVDRVIIRNETHTVSHDYWVPGFSAGWVAGHTFEDFPNDPYLTPDSKLVDDWKMDCDQIKIGIRWAGNPQFEHHQYRRFPEKFITNLSKYKDIQLYSLQRDDNLVDLPKNIIDLQEHLTTWEDTMGAIANLDLVISSCTSVAHLAAAMGKEVWVLVPILPYHTWATGAPEATTTPYYKTVTIFRQKHPKLWNETFQSLYRALEVKFDLPKIDMPNEDSETFIDRIYKPKQKQQSSPVVKKIEPFNQTNTLLYSRKSTVDKAYIITLNDNEQSLKLSARCQESCNNVGMNYQVWDAFNGYTNPITFPQHSVNSDVMNMIKVTDHYLTRTELACALSHISLWVHCCKIDQPIVILEHDAIVVKKFEQHMTMNSIVYLGGAEWAKQGWPVQPVPPYASEGPNYLFMCRAHAYSIDPLVAKNLVAHVIRYGINAPLDIMLRADIFHITHQGLYAYDDNASINETTITERPVHGRTTERNDNLAR